MHVIALQLVQYLDSALQLELLLGQCRWAASYLATGNNYVYNANYLCKQSKTGGVKGLGMSLIVGAVYSMWYIKFQVECTMSCMEMVATNFQFSRVCLKIDFSLGDYQSSLVPAVDET